MRAAQLLNLRPPEQALERCIEIALLQVHLRMPGFEDEPADRWNEPKFTTLLLNLSGCPEVRRGLHALSVTYRDVSCVVSSESEAAIARTLHSLLDEEADAEVEVILVLPKVDPQKLALAKTLVDILRAHATSRASTVIGLAACPAEWHALAEVDGWLEAENAEALGRTATSLFKLLSVQSAPSVLACLDQDEMMAPLGPPDSPARLVLAHWVHDPNALVFSSSSDRATVASSDCLVTAPFAASLPRNSFGRLLRLATDVAKPGSVCFVNISVDYFASSQTLPSGCCQVAFLCRHVSDSSRSSLRREP